MDREYIEEKLAELPVAQYEWIETDELEFTERVRMICRSECPMYGKTWACPPAVGSVDECEARCRKFKNALLFTTLREVDDIADIEATLATRKEHEDIASLVAELIKGQCSEVYILSTEACDECEECTYPDAPCRFPERMHPCVESHGILATNIAEKRGIEFYDGNIVTWFSIIFYK